MIGRLKDMTKSRDGREWVISFSTPTDFREQFDQLADKMINVEIKQHRNRRSLEANAYCWVLVGEIAKKMNLPKNEVYRKAIIDSGVYTIHCIPDDQIETAVEDWKSFGIGFQVETFPSKTPGCTNAVFYKGSSYYDTAQMARLIKGLISDAESLGIPTITEKEYESMIGDWGKKKGGNENVGSHSA